MLLLASTQFIFFYSAPLFVARFLVWPSLHSVLFCSALLPWDKPQRAQKASVGTLEPGTDWEAVSPLPPSVSQHVMESLALMPKCEHWVEFYIPL